MVINFPITHFGSKFEYSYYGYILSTWKTRTFVANLKCKPKLYLMVVCMSAIFLETKIESYCKRKKLYHMYMAILTFSPCLSNAVLFCNLQKMF
jgi:hypothetical protein